jgi:hypothetical protein
MNKDEIVREQLLSLLQGGGLSFRWADSEKPAWNRRAVLLIASKQS